MTFCVYLQFKLYISISRLRFMKDCVTVWRQYFYQVWSRCALDFQFWYVKMPSTCKSLVWSWKEQLSQNNHTLWKRIKDEASISNRYVATIVKEKNRTNYMLNYKHCKRVFVSSHMLKTSLTKTPHFAYNDVSWKKKSDSDASNLQQKEYLKRKPNTFFSTITEKL